ncbi:MAG: GtrA family protein [Croceibacterium sp.]
MVGGFVTSVSTAIYYSTSTYVRVPPLLANLLGYIAGVGLGFFLHSRVSFRGHGRRDRIAGRTARSAVVSLTTFTLNSLFVGLLTGPLHGPTWWPVIPMVGVTPLVAFWLYRQWVFA